MAPDTHFGELHGAPIQHQETAGEGAARTAEYFEHFSRLHGADDANQWGKNPHRGATGFFKSRLRWEYAGITGRTRIARVVDANLPVKADGSP